MRRLGAQSPHGEAEREPEQDQREDPEVVCPSGAEVGGGSEVDGHHAERAGVERDRPRSLRLQLAGGQQAAV